MIDREQTPFSDEDIARMKAAEWRADPVGKGVFALITRLNIDYYINSLLPQLPETHSRSLDLVTLYSAIRGLFSPEVQAATMTKSTENPDQHVHLAILTERNKIFPERKFIALWESLYIPKLDRNVRLQKWNIVEDGELEWYSRDVNVAIKKVGFDAPVCTVPAGALELSHKQEEAITIFENFVKGHVLE
jgi:hypothetical protein